MYLSTFQVLYKLYLSTDVLKYKVLLPGSGLLYNLTVIPVVWGSYYRNVICIARSVGVGGNWVICYLKGCNMSRLCLDEYFSLFYILHYCNFHSKS